MAAYLIAFAKVKNANRIPEYSPAAGPTLGASGGSVVTRGKVRSLVGGFSADSCLIVKFKDAAAIEAWHDSPGYQALIPLRDDVQNTLRRHLPTPPFQSPTLAIRLPELSVRWRSH